MASQQELNAWGIIEVKGTEAIPFLQTQFTQSVNDLAEFEVRQAGFCTAKGRLLGTFFALQPEAETIWLLTRRDLIEPLVKRLTMFKLRMKCSIADLSSRLCITVASPSEGMKAMTFATNEHGVLLNLGSETHSIALQIQVQDSVSRDNNELTSADKRLQGMLITAGLAYICNDVVEKYTPQEINMDLTGGVSFKKGCYPGQEVVARSHYLGKVKRRAFLAEANREEIKEGTDVWLIGKANEPVGSVVAVGQIDEKLVALMELPVQEALNEASRFSFESAESSHTFGVSPPPYDVTAKPE